MVLKGLVNAGKRFGDLVHPAPELGNEVLIDDHWLTRLAGPLDELAAGAALLDVEPGTPTWSCAG